jgi:hypothetical protein
VNRLFSATSSATTISPFLPVAGIPNKRRASCRTQLQLLALISLACSTATQITFAQAPRSAANLLITHLRFKFKRKTANRFT